MDPLDTIYWIKLCLGVLAAIICILLRVNNLITGTGIGFATYAISDRILRQIFIDKIEKSTEVTKTGAGIYAITFLFSWILLYTFIITSG
ncbi:TPA: hypothetical protein EYP70_03325 [Candidatus Bathyarchaeota archaeon]|nr:hypothetical protein [Candidatus Bathyarchaeota archaeon]